MKAYREHVNTRLGKLDAELDRLEPRVEKLHLAETTKHDATELAQVSEGLQAIEKQAKASGEWVRDSAPSRPAHALKEKALKLTDTLAAYTAALERQAGGSTVPEMNQLRGAWPVGQADWVNSD